MLRHPHERGDGSGYPDGLAGEQIPLLARILAVVDVYDALTSNRAYRPAWSPDRARTHVREQAGHPFDPNVVAAWTCLVGSEVSPGTRNGSSHRRVEPAVHRGPAAVHHQHRTRHVAGRV